MQKEIQTKQHLTYTKTGIADLGEYSEAYPDQIPTVPLDFSEDLLIGQRNIHNRFHGCKFGTTLDTSFWKGF